MSNKEKKPYKVSRTSRFFGVPGWNPDTGEINIVGHMGPDGKPVWLPGKEPRRNRLPPPPPGYVDLDDDE